MAEHSNINTSEPIPFDRCPICGKMESHIHIDYETDEELKDYLDFCGTLDTLTGKQIIYTKVPEGQGTGTTLDRLIGPFLDALCDEECFWNEEDTEG